MKILRIRAQVRLMRGVSGRRVTLSALFPTFLEQHCTTRSEVHGILTFGMIRQEDSPQIGSLGYSSLKKKKPSKTDMLHKPVKSQNMKQEDQEFKIILDSTTKIKELCLLPMKRWQPTNWLLCCYCNGFLGAIQIHSWHFIYICVYSYVCTRHSACRGQRTTLGLAWQQVPDGFILGSVYYYLPLSTN